MTGRCAVMKTKAGVKNIKVLWQSGPMQRIANPENRQFESDQHLQKLFLIVYNVNYEKHCCKKTTDWLTNLPGLLQ